MRADKQAGCRMLQKGCSQSKPLPEVSCLGAQDEMFSLVTVTRSSASGEDNGVMPRLSAQNMAAAQVKHIEGEEPAIASNVCCSKGHDRTTPKLPKLGTWCCASGLAARPSDIGKSHRPQETQHMCNGRSESEIFASIC